MEYEKQRWRILQNIPPYQYKTQIEIIVASTRLHNHTLRISQDDVVFIKYDLNSNFILDKVLPNIVARVDSQGLQGPSPMNFIHDGIINGLIGQ